MFAIKFLLLLVVSIVVVFFLVINSYYVDVNYYNLMVQKETVELPFSIVVVVLMLSGFFMSWILGFIERCKLKKVIRKQGRRLKVVEKELENFKLLPQNYLDSSVDSVKQIPENTTIGNSKSLPQLAEPVTSG